MARQRWCIVRSRRHVSGAHLIQPATHKLNVFAIVAVGVAFDHIVRGIIRADAAGKFEGV